VQVESGQTHQVEENRGVNAKLPTGLLEDVLDQEVLAAVIQNRVPLGKDVAQLTEDAQGVEDDELGVPEPLELVDLFVQDLGNQERIPDHLAQLPLQNHAELVKTIVLG